MHFERLILDIKKLFDDSFAFVLGVWLRCLLFTLNRAADLDFILNRRILILIGRPIWMKASILNRML